MTKSENSKQRSNQQNKYYWGKLLEDVEGFYRNNQTAFILDVLEAVDADITPEFIHEMLKMRFNDRQSTTRNTTKTMEEYMLKLRVFFQQKHGLDIPPPNEPPLEELVIGKNYEN